MQIEITPMVASSVQQVIAKTAAVDSSSDIEILEGAGAMAGVAEAWAYLEQRGGAATPFQSYSLASACLAAHVRRQATPRIIIQRKGGKPGLILPTVITKIFGFPVVKFLGDPLIQYGDALASTELQVEDIARVLSVAIDPNVACLAVFRRVRDDARIAGALAWLAKETGLQESPLVNLKLPSALNSRHLREQRRQQRRLAERGKVEVRFLCGTEAQPFLFEALSFKRAWIKKHGFESAVIGCPDWEQAICESCSLNPSQLIVAVLSCGGRTAAIEVAFINSGSWFGFLGAFSPEFASAGPGQILLLECMRWAREKGLSVYDQLPPSQEYKRRYATHSVVVRDYAMPLTKLGRLPLSMIRMIPTIKWILAQVPEEARLGLLKLSGH